MDKQEHGRRLKAAMANQGLGREVVADAVEKGTRTVTNWTSGYSMPDDTDRAKLRRLLGHYDHPGDPVEAAIRSSGLIAWRQDAVLSEYRRHVHLQAAEDAG